MRWVISASADALKIGGLVWHRGDLHRFGGHGGPQITRLDEVRRVVPIVVDWAVIVAPVPLFLFVIVTIVAAIA